MTLAKLLQLDCPLAFLDCEATGTNREYDRVVQIGVEKHYPDGRVSDWETLVNPCTPIPPEISEIHKITDDMVKSAPTFAELAPKLAEGFSKCDFGGYNVVFDLDILQQEFKRCGSKFEFNGRIVDANKIFHSRERRTLTAAMKYYLNEDLPDAHNALVDVKASSRVFAAQLERYPDLPRDVGALHRMFFETPEGPQVDPEGKFSWRFGEACFNFGNKYVNVPLREVARRDPGYLRWMLKANFSYNVQRIVKEALDGKFPVRTAK